MELSQQPKKRGSYRKYLKDSNIPIPKTSNWRLKKLEERYRLLITIIGIKSFIFLTVIQSVLLLPLVFQLWVVLK